jgi:hypothetical protein
MKGEIGRNDDAIRQNDYACAYVWTPEDVGFRCVDRRINREIESPNTDLVTLFRRRAPRA